jgi:hypothetical protein
MLQFRKIKGFINVATLAEGDFVEIAGEKAIKEHHQNTGTSRYGKVFQALESFARGYISICYAGMRKVQCRELLH